jgi:ribosome biogenesis GTPase
MIPLPGDLVEISVDGNGCGVIDRIQPRRNSLYRPAAANIDAMLIVMAAASPDPDMYLLDKLLVLTEIKGIHPIICVNKTDIDGGRAAAIRDCYSRIGYECIEVSAVGDPEGSRAAILDAVSRWQTVVLTGQSGVGKSTIVNLILGREQMLRGELSAKLQRGRNTTRHAELVKLECGTYAIDTPGFTSFVNEGIYRYELKDYYPEYRDCGGECRFADCRHESEPDCRVKELVESGELDRGRYERYLELSRSLKTNKWSD